MLIVIVQEMLSHEALVHKMQHIKCALAALDEG